jgi:murein endopeptidase
MNEIKQKLVEWQVITAEQSRTFGEADIIEALEGMHQALEMLAKNHTVLMAENKQLQGSKPLNHSSAHKTLDVQHIVQAQREAIDEVRVQNPSWSYAQAFNRAIRDFPSIFEQDAITVEA